MRSIALIFLLSMVVLKGISQDNHYWYMKSGGEASGMGNAVLAGIRDNSAVYYNPGALGFIDDLSISINATVYMAQLSRLFNAMGEGLTLQQWRYTYYPQMLSGMLPFKKLDRWRFAYTLMTRYNSYYRFNMLHVTKYDVIEQFQGDETYIGSYQYFNELSEQWGGLGAAFKLSEKISIGVSAYASYRNQSFQQSISTRSIPVQDTAYYLVSISDNDDIRYIHWKGIFKLGLAVDLDRWKLGLTITTPSFAIYGDADVQREVSIINYSRLEGAIAGGDLLAIDRQTFLPMHNRTPLSIAGGARYQSDNTSVEINAEYFFGIKPYKMINTEGQIFLYPAELIPEDIQQEFDFLAVYNYKNPVLNAGIGLKQIFSDRWDLLCGFHTDFNFQRIPEDVEGFVIPGSTWNLYHFTGGFNYKMKSSLLTLGVDYYMGIENNMTQTINFRTPKDYLGLTGELSDDAYTRIHGLAGVISFTYFFQEKQSLPF